MSLPVHTSAESDAVTDACANTPRVSGTSTLHPESLLPRDRVRRPSTKSMSTTFQGASGPRGHAGTRLAFGQLTVSGSHTAPEPSLMSLQQTLPEQSIFREIRKLIVRLFVGASDLRANKLPGGTSTLLKPYWLSTRYDPLLLTKHLSDQPEGAVCDKGKGRHTVEVAG